MAAKPDSGPAAQDGHEEGKPVGVDARSGAPGTAVSTRRHESLNLHQQRPRALERGPGDAAGRVLIGSGQECPAGVDDLRQSALRHLEDTDFLGGAETVLGSAEQSQGRGPLALEIQHRVDEVLQRLGPGQGAVLGYVADEDDRDSFSLGHLHEPKGALADLADAACGPLQLIDGHRLDRVDDQRNRPCLSGQVDDPTYLRLGHDRNAIASGAFKQTKASRSQTNLSGRLLAGGVQYLAALAARAAGAVPRATATEREPGRGLQQQRGLADARLAAKQHGRPRNQAAAQYPVYLSDAGRDPDRLGLPQSVQRLWRTGPAAGTGSFPGRRSRPGVGANRQGAGLTDDRLDESVPRPTRPTLPLPADMGSATRLTDVAALLAGHPSASAQRAASTGCFSSTGWMSRPASEPLSTMMLVP